MVGVGHLAERLGVARRGSGLSARKVAALLGGRVSHSTVVNYEKGATVPPISMVAALADLYARPLSWFLESGAALTGVRYRAVASKLKVSDRHIYEGLCLKWFEAYLRIERRLEQRLGRMVAIKEVPVAKGVRESAAFVRSVMNVGDGPIWSIVEVLHAFGIRTMEIPTDLPIWALAAKLGDEHVVALNPKASADRCRLSAGHELGHILFGDCAGGAASEGDEKAIEARAYEFGSLLLMPPGVLRKYCEPRSMVTLVQAKEQYGISLSAMIYAAQREKVLPASVCKKLWIEFSRRGWRENEPGKVRADRALRFEQLVDGAMFSGRLTVGEAAEIAGVREEEMRSRLQLALGIEQYSRNAEMKESNAAEEGFQLRLVE